MTYEDEASITAKGQYANRIGLGGTIIWLIEEGSIKDAANLQAPLQILTKAFWQLNMPCPN